MSWLHHQSTFHEQIKGVGEKTACSLPAFLIKEENQRWLQHPTKNIDIFPNLMHRSYTLYNVYDAVL